VARLKAVDDDGLPKSKTVEGELMSKGGGRNGDRECERGREGGREGERLASGQVSFRERPSNEEGEKNNKTMS
jgi:hypothetical protein